MILDELVSLAKQRSKDIVESGEEHIPMFLALTPGGVALAHIVMADKNTFKSVFTELLMKLNAYAYVMINEAWMAKVNGNSPLLEKLLSGEVTVSELPLDDKEEILTITAVDNGKSYRCWTAKINYDHDSRHLGEWEKVSGEAEVTGRIVLKEW